MDWYELLPFGEQIVQRAYWKIKNLVGGDSLVARFPRSGCPDTFLNHKFKMTGDGRVFMFPLSSMKGLSEISPA